MTAHTRASPSVAGQVVPREGSEPADAAEPAPMNQYDQERFDSFGSTDSEQRNVESVV